MIITKDLFSPYKQAIINCIGSCTSMPQMHCCWDMLDRFREVFKNIVDVKLIIKASDEIVETYMIRQAEIMVS